MAPGDLRITCFFFFADQVPLIAARWLASFGLLVVPDPWTNTAQGSIWYGLLASRSVIWLLRLHQHLRTPLASLSSGLRSVPSNPRPSLPCRSLFPLTFFFPFPRCIDLELGSINNGGPCFSLVNPFFVPLHYIEQAGQCFGVSGDSSWSRHPSMKPARRVLACW